MDLAQFFAGRTGAARLPDGQAAVLESVDLGMLRVRSGRLALCDAIWLEAPLVVPVPPGEYRVGLTRAAVPETYAITGHRDAYLSIVLSDSPTVRIEPARVEPDSTDWRDTPAGGLAGVPGLVGVPTTMYNIAVVDADAIAPGMPEDPDTWYESVVSGWFATMDTDALGPHGTVNAVLPRSATGDNIVVALTGGGALPFPVIASCDASGRMTGVHVDLLAMGDLATALGAEIGPDRFLVEEQEAERQAEQRAERRGGIRGFWDRLTGRD
ncbi:DUF4241 domain-containing protein [Leucobacter zeae]|nr:DUF4241 domain-containing protein [Leucobacter zeae]